MILKIQKIYCKKFIWTKKFYIYFRVLVTIGLLIILPLLSTYFGLNDTIILALCAALDGSGINILTRAAKLVNLYIKKILSTTPLLVRKNGRLKTAHYWKFTLYKSSNSANFH